jgi:DNA polymerase-3 subunit alpha
LLGQHAEGLIAINGHLGSEIGDHLLAYSRSNEGKHWEAAVESARWHARVFGREPVPRFYVELQHHVREQNQINPLLIRLARQEGLPLVCDNDAHFLRAEDHDTHDTLICISTAKGKRDEHRMRYPSELYVKSPAQMRELFAGEAYNNADFGEAGKEALANTRRIAEACDVQLAIGVNHAPMVRVAPPKPGELPLHDDARFAGDLSAWYAAYCGRFELMPYRAEEGPAGDEDRAKAKRDCDDALRRLAHAGFRWRYGVEPAASDHARDADHAAKSARLERELRILAEKGISAYFLIVWDFVNWGRNNGVPALARGSGVGTMVGYVLGLSNACPVQFGLLFERFTDPDRSEYPDIDIDLCQDGRGKVIEYVRQKYGHVAQIITFGTLKARAAMRDVGRVLEMPIPEVDRLCKLVPEALGTTIRDALEQEPELRGQYERDGRVRELIDQAMALEGHTRHAGVHAAGVIVATRPLHEIVPLYKQPGTDDSAIAITQWDGPTCEKMGLLKMDFLGLRTISVIERAKRLIRETMSEAEVWASVGRVEEFEQIARGSPSGRPTASPHPLDLDRLAFTDQRVFDLFRRGETTGVFQFESGGMRRLLMEMKPDRLEDLIAANALFRPGPMDLIPDYNRRKHGGETVPAVHPIVDEFTRETYGVMVYQEQVMQIVHGLGGIKLRDAYSLIKNISKKKHDKIEKERPKFIEGSVRQGLTKERANDLFELILKFAGYGFNKSHSTGYAIVAYQTAYLKTFFPAQYMAAFLTYESQASKVSEWIPYLEDCRRTRIIDPRSPDPRAPAVVTTGIEVRPPDINLSQAAFSVVREQGVGHGASGTSKDQRTPGANPTARSPSAGAEPPHIRFGLKGIKGSGDRAVEAIVRERERSGPFTSLFDFCERVPLSLINKATIESLVKCGAFDALHGRDQRAAMVASVDAACQAGARLAQDRAAGQGGLFLSQAGAKAGDARVPTAVALPKIAAWNEKETLAHEKDTLGFYVSSHPLERWRFWTDAFATASCSRLKEFAQDARVVLPAMIQSVRQIVIRNGRSAGQKMAILTAEDATGAADCVLFSDNFLKFSHLAAAEAVVFVLGRMDYSRGEAQVIVDRLVPVEGVPFDTGKVRLYLDETRLNGSASRVLASIAATLRETKPAARTPADVSRFPVEVVIGTESSVAVLAVDGNLRLPVEHERVRGFVESLGAGMVKVVGGFTVEKEKPKPWERKRGNSADE